MLLLLLLLLRLLWFTLLFLKISKMPEINIDHFENACLQCQVI
jgi:hypothetical protein